MRSKSQWAIAGLIPAGLLAVAAAATEFARHRELRLLRRGGDESESRAQPSRETLSDQEAAQLDHRRFTSVLEASSDFVAFMDERGKAIYINPAGRIMIGLTPDQPLDALCIADVHPAPSLKLVLEVGLPTAIREGQWRGETEFVDRRGRITPVLQLIQAHRDADGEIDFISTIARDITERKRYEARLEEANRRLQVLATVDELTGLFNRRAFNTRLTQEIEIAKRNNRPLSLIMVDIDRFKRVNDEWGHDHGDVILRRVGSLLRESVRPQDVASRFGGEEMVIILPDTDRDGALAAAERCRKAFEVENWPVVKITISCGAATLCDTCRTADSLIKDADNALYASKQAGRNRSTHASELES